MVSKPGRHPTMASSFEKFLTKHRGLVIFLFAVPISFVWQLVLDLEQWIFLTFKNTNKLHDAKVQKIQDEVRKASKSGKKMCTARKPWATISSRNATFKKDLAQISIDLRNVLNLDINRKVVKVEPMVTMGDLSHYLIPKGYSLAVLAEMDDLTVGGLCMGVGIETTSHRYGFLSETVEAYWIVTADGNLVRATRTENVDLFRALPWSHGTLGFLVAVEIKVVPIKPYMHVTYHPFHSQEEFTKVFKEMSESQNPPSFLEGLIFSPQHGVIMCGEMAEVDTLQKRLKVNSINLWHKPWFYKHAEKYLDKGKGEEYIPLRHYFHRHTPSVFFQLKDLIPFANKFWYRWLFAWMGAPKIALLKMSTTKELRKQAFYNRVAQDVVIPVQHMDKCLDFVHEKYKIYPLWICPVKIVDHGEQEGFLRNPNNPIPGRDYEMYVDIGVYGIPPDVELQNWNGIDTSKELEQMVTEMKGYHMLYADIFMNQSEFESMFNHTLYRVVRTKYGADKAFPEVYNKVVPEKWLYEAK